MANLEKLREYKEKLTTPLKQATLVFLIRNDEILLAMKKRGFGEGKWNGVGGKREITDKSIDDAAKREAYEEIGVSSLSLEKVAEINFYWATKPEGTMQVTVFLSNKWDGEPADTDEMTPKWCGQKNIPYDQMLEDEQYWLPLVLEGKKLEADFLFDEEQKLIEKDIRIVESIS
ncbi:MAG TPA: 8-oxo-dGTP diphosphatase [Alphaproteobacteria bacterium]|jgi:ADP-ribose pyrophosphatase YjhB (NUDIX family)|nr:8-oxo-dGTP diphosphatase [Alphaproteobacteria bacterium]